MNQKVLLIDYNGRVMDPNNFSRGGKPRVWTAGILEVLRILDVLSQNDNGLDEQFCHLNVSAETCSKIES
jgi:hypothetical protein